MVADLTSTFSHMAELQQSVLAGLVSNHLNQKALSARMAYALPKLYDELFEGEFYPIWRLVSRYYPILSGLPSPGGFDELLESNVKLSVTDRIRLSQSYSKLADSPVSDIQFKLAVIRIAERYRDDRLQQVLSDALRIHTASATISGTTLAGYDDTISYLGSHLSQLDKLVRVEDSHEGDINLEVSSVLKSYIDAQSGRQTGTLTGFTELDTSTHGLQPGELCLLAGYCQPAGELVWADRGMVPIEELSVGEGVSCNGVVKRIYKFGPKPTVRIKVTDFPEKTFTHDHPVCIFRPCISTKRLCWPGCSQRHTHKPWLQLTVPACELRRNDVVMVPVPEGEDVPSPLTFKVRSDHGRCRYSISVPFDSDFLRMLALYVSDGSLIRTHGIIYGLQFAFGKRSAPNADWFESYLNSMRIPHSHRIQGEHSFNIHIYSSLIGRWVYSEFGQGSKTKRIPGWVLRLPKNLVAAFLDGYVDGSHSFPDRPGRSYTSFNKQLIESIALLNSKLGRGGSLKAIFPGPTSFFNTSGPYYRYQVCGSGGRHRWLVPGFMLSRVQKVECGLSLPVYGLETETGWYNTPFQVHNTSEGKSKVAYNIAHHACYMQGKNVVFAANEATRDQVRLNLVSRHSHHPRFGLERGLRYSDIRFGSLSKDDEEVLKLVLQDMRHGTDHGRMYVVQLPYRATLDNIADVIARQSKVYPIDLVIIDYLGLFSSSRRASRREELEDVLSTSKRLAVDKNLPIISPWQMSREAWREAVRVGYYTRAALADTSRAEKDSDLIVSLLKPEDAPNTLKCQILKNRNGEAGIDFTLHTDFSTCYVTSMMQQYQNLLG